MRHIIRITARAGSNSQAGITLALVALMIVVLFMMAALAIDLGIAYTARTSAQHAADAAALAGAYAYVDGSTLPADTLAGVIAAYAAAVANKYNVLDHAVNISNSPRDLSACSSGENIVCVDLAKKRVTVVVSSPVNVYFAKVMPGLDLLKVKVRATAEAGQNAMGDRCIKPFYVSNDIISPLPKDMDPLLRCTQSMQNGTTILDASGNLTPYAQQWIAAQANSNFRNTCTAPGCAIPFWSQNDQNPSQYGLIDFSAGEDNSGALLACAVEHCFQECFARHAMFRCSDTVVGQKTGGSVGQVEKALKAVTQYGNDFSRNMYVSAPPPQFQNLDSSWPSTTSPSLLSVLVWDCMHPMGNGTQPVVAVKGIAQVFVNRVANSQGSGGGSKGNGGGGNPGSTLFLVSANGCNADEQRGAGTGGVPIRLVNPN